MELFYFLPACHYARTATEAYVTPHLLEVAVVDDADVRCLAREGRHLVALEVVVVVGHCVCEAADHCFGDV